jgi:single-stranded DNA-binding protein
MADEIEFIDGLIFKPPHEKAPDFVICKLSIKREQLIEWLEGRDDEWINGDVKESKGGKYYASVDNWKPNQDRQESPAPRQQAPARQPAPQQAPLDDFADDDIPF